MEGTRIKDADEHGEKDADERGSRTRINADQETRMDADIRGNPRFNPRRSALQGQASLETVFAIWGSLLLVFGSFVIMRWMVDRLVTRQEAYDDTRLAAAAWSYCDPSRYIKKGKAIPATCKQALPATIEARPKQGDNPAVVLTREQIEQAWAWEDNDPAEEIPLKIFDEQ